MRIHIEKDGKQGTVLYDDKNSEVLISHPDDKVRRVVHQYLTNSRDFKVPTPTASNAVGGYHIVNIVPTHHPAFFDMAMNELNGATGVKVDWSHKDNKGSSYFEEPNKPIVKSIDGQDYEIIN